MNSGQPYHRNHIFLIANPLLLLFEGEGRVGETKDEPTIPHLLPP